MGERLTILVAGCGYVGCELARQAVAAGHDVIGLRRSPEKALDLPEAVRRFTADLTDPATLTDLPPVDAVAFTTAPNNRELAAYRAAYVDGLRNLLAALQPRRDRLRRFVMTSSTGVYGQQDGSVITEDSPANPTTDTGRAILEGERLLQDELPAGVGVALRLAGIYGPASENGLGRVVPRLVRQVVDGTVAYDETEPSFINVIHRDDAAGALLHLLTMADSPPPAVNGVDHEPPDRRALFQGIAECLGIPLPPSFPGQAPPRGRNKRCSNTALLATGYRFRYPTWRDGMPDLIVDPANDFAPE